ncbi:MAG TPA: SDR family NAD(P)-dependent oxidoreductase [Candidatus Binatia bacterium]|nr:SDR family NAD(P)-dependent oxidoreductase [Candidatus Binatia bacterium]
MVGMSDSAVLVTGATGFIGRHIVRCFVDAGRRVIVLARCRAGISVRERLAKIFPECSTQLEILEGDLASPAGIQKGLAPIRSNIGTVIHCAGETSFVFEDRESTRLVHIDGVLALLRALHAEGLRCWAQISTAFVCGRRSGIIYENESDVGQAFNNEYERLKLELEIRLKQACHQRGVDLRIFRPSIVVGGAPATAGGAPSNLLLAFLRLLSMLAGKSDKAKVRVRIQARPQARFNIVPVDYVAKAIEHLTDEPEASGRTFHLVSTNPPIQRDVLAMINERLGLQHVYLIDAAEEVHDCSPLEMRVARMLLPYRYYLRQDVQFDDTATRSLLVRRGIQPAVIDAREVNRLIELARSYPNGDR